MFASQSTYITASLLGENKIKARVISTKIVVDGHDKAYDVRRKFMVLPAPIVLKRITSVLCACVSLGIQQ